VVVMAPMMAEARAIPESPSFHLVTVVLLWFSYF
jgi:hypothetical protein